MVGVSALCRWTVSTLISKSLPFTKGMLGHNSGSKRGVYSMSWISGCIVAVKNFDRSLTSPVENMDQYDGSQFFSTVYSPGLMVSNLPDNAMEIHGIIHLFNYQFKVLQPVDMFVLNNCMKFR